MDASITINVTQQVVFWLLLFILLAWMVIFAWLALRKDEEKKHVRPEETIVRTGPLTASVAPALHVMIEQPVHEPVGVGVPQSENIQL